MLVDTNSCVVPWEVIADVGNMNVYVEGISGNVVATTAEMTTPIRILKSGKTTASSPSAPTPDIYSQILALIRDVQFGEVGEAVIAQEVSNYLAENPISGVNPSEVEEIIADYIIEHRDSLAGTDGNDGMSPTITTARNTNDNGYDIIITDLNGSNTISVLDGTNGVDGINGVDGANGTNGINGVDGREIELNKSDTHIQWHYAGDETWTNLVALADLTGANGIDGTNGANGTNGSDGADGEDGTDGREVELQTSETHIQWRYVGDATLLASDEIDHLESGRNDQFQPDRKSQYTSFSFL